jgi:hypothetical protein
LKEINITEYNVSKFENCKVFDRSKKISWLGLKLKEKKYCIA